jgi:hypothetical protein
LLNVFVPRKDFKSGSGDYYLMALFEKLPDPEKTKDFLLFDIQDFEDDIPEDKLKDITDSAYTSPGHSFRIGSKGFSPGLQIPVNELPGADNALIRITGSFNIPPGFPEGKIILVVEVRDERGKMYRYLKAKNGPEHPQGEWFSLSFQTAINKLATENGVIKIYAWSQADEEVLVDDLSVEYFPMEE